MIARPISQSFSLSDRKLSSSVIWVMRWRQVGLPEGGHGFYPDRQRRQRLPSKAMM